MVYCADMLVLVAAEGADEGVGGEGGEGEGEGHF